MSGELDCQSSCGPAFSMCWNISIALRVNVLKIRPICTVPVCTPFIGETTYGAETLHNCREFKGESKIPLGKSRERGCGKRERGEGVKVKSSQAAAKSVFGFSRHNGGRTRQRAATSLSLSLTLSVRWTAATQTPL